MGESAKKQEEMEQITVITGDSFDEALPENPDAEDEPIDIEAGAETETPESSEPETTEPQATEEAVESGKAKPGDEDEEPEPNAELKAEIEALKKEVQKANNRAGYALRELEKRTEKQTKQDKEEAFESELKERFPEPKEDDFDSFEDFKDAQTQWKIDVGIERGLHKKAATEETTKAVDTERSVFVTETIDSGKEAYSDFADVVLKETVPITDEIIDYAFNMDNEKVTPADIFYYLGKNPTETAKISRMNPDRVNAALAKIEVKLEDAKEKAGTAAASTKPKSKVKDVSEASEPISPTDSTVVITKDPDKMTQSEYEKWRQEGGGS